MRSIDRSGFFIEKTLTITVNDVNEAPVIMSNGGGSTASVDVFENSQEVMTLAATDPDAGDSVTWSAGGGADAALFDISATGQLSFVTAPDFEAPSDHDGNNAYEVAVRATDSGGLYVDQTLTIRVANVNEAPEGSANAALPDGRIGRSYTLREADLLSGFTDAEGDTLTVVNLAASIGTLTDHGDGTWTLTPPLFFTGEVVLTYQVTDGIAPAIGAVQSFDIVLPPDTGGGNNGGEEPSNPS